MKLPTQQPPPPVLTDNLCEPWGHRPWVQILVPFLAVGSWVGDWASVYSSVQWGQYWHLRAEVSSEGICVTAEKSGWAPAAIRTKPAGLPAVSAAARWLCLVSAVPPGGEDSPEAAAGLCGILGVQCTSPDSGRLCRGHEKGWVIPAHSVIQVKVSHVRRFPLFVSVFKAELRRNRIPFVWTLDIRKQMFQDAHV